MSRKIILYVLLLCGLFVTAPALHAKNLAGKRSRLSKPKTSLKRTRRYAPHHVIVKFKEPDDNGRRAASLVKSIGATEKHRFRHGGARLLKLPPGRTVDDVIKKLRANPAVEYAERDHYLTIHQTAPPLTEPNDPYYTDQYLWGLHNTGYIDLGGGWLIADGLEDADMDAPEAWSLSTGSSDVLVAVIDTGVYYEHPDLAANMWTNPGETPNDGIDNDGNGIIDDVHGMKAYEGVLTGDPDDDHGHGTHVAGIIGAVGNNAEGVTGVCWTVRIMALKFLDSTGYGLESDAALCMEYALANGAKIVNNSYGGPDYSQALYEQFEAARDQGVLCCAAAGNSSKDNDVEPHYPSNFDLDNIIAVAATDKYDNLAYFSHYGRQTVDVGAPGEGIWSTWNVQDLFSGDYYSQQQGTSMASPMVVGAAALVLAYHKQLMDGDPGLAPLSMTDLRNRILWTGDPLTDLEETTYTGLRVNVYNALMARYDVRILTTSPLPNATVDTYYETGLEASSFGSAVSWSIPAVPYVETETENRYRNTGTAQGWQADEGMWSLAFPIGFTFPFYGETFSSVHVCSNGYLQFGATSPSSDNEASKSGLADKKMIAVYWMDLTSAAGDIYTQYIPDPTGADPNNDAYCIRWDVNEIDFVTGGTGVPVNVEVVLYRDGRIEMNYGPDTGYESFFGGTIGVSKGDGVTYKLSKKSDQLQLMWAPTSLWDAGRFPPGLTFASTGDTTAAITGTPTIAGNYTFDVVAENASGRSDIQRYDLKVRPIAAPTADFLAWPTRIAVSEGVQFTDLSESTAAGGITSWEWNFGDGTTNTDQNPSHTYTSVGFFTVSLTVTDANGSDQVVKLRHITCFKSGPTADFSATPLTGDAPLTVTFTDLSTPDPHAHPDDGEIWYWRWDFGDGTISERYDSASFDHTYEQPGIYTVILEVHDLRDCAGFERKIEYITVTGGGPALGVSVTPATFDFGFLEPSAVVTNAGSALVVENTGEVNEDISIRIKDEDDRGEWTSGTPGQNTYTLSTRLADVMGTFGVNDKLTTVLQWCDGTILGEGGDNIAPAATVNQWFQFQSPTATTGAHAGSQHIITVEVGCRQAE